MRFSIVTFFLSSILSSYCFSTVSELVQFKIHHAQIIKQNRMLEIRNFGEKVNKKRIREVDIEECLPLMEKMRISDSWVVWFKKSFQGRKTLTYKEFAGAIFYPHEILETTHKQHLSQMNYAFKASVMYSSIFNPTGSGKIMSSYAFEAKDFDGDFLRFFDLGFIATNASFIEQIKIKEKNTPGFLDSIKSDILLAGTVLMKLNLGFILKNFNAESDAICCFNRAAEMGSMRAKIELGKVYIKHNFLHGLAYFESLGSYGFWKIAQCYRYGIQIKRNLNLANTFYLKAIQDTVDVSQYPEILFDSADFSVYYAYSQRDKEVFKQVMRKATQRFLEVGTFGLGLGYLKAAETSSDATALCPELITDNIPEFQNSFKEQAIQNAFVHGHVGKVTSFNKKTGVIFTEDVEIRALSEQIDRS